MACSGGERGGDGAIPMDAPPADQVVQETSVGPTGPCEGSMVTAASCSTDVECDDGLSCNGIDICVGEFGCVCDPENPPLACDDLKSCTVDSCQEPSGTCSHEPDDSRCADDGNECRTPLCEPERSEDHTGCVYEPVPNGIPCDAGNGACFDGFCCHGCWDGMNCQAGTSEVACGAIGAMCAACDDGDPCTEDACTDLSCAHTSLVCADTGSDCSYAECHRDMGGCVTTSLPDATPCDGGSGFCMMGDCCHGCYEGAVCHEPGTDITACGELGGTCADCDDLNACTTDTCDAGVCSNSTTDCDDSNDCTMDGCNRLSGCTHRSEADSTVCAGGAGQCHMGDCCEGCWDGAVCLPGDGFSSCGSAGEMCEDCDDANPCTIDRCTTSGCEHVYIGDGMACGGGGFCFGGECCMGCRDGDTCRPGTSRTACGSGGLTVCRSCECPTDDCADGAICPPSRYRITAAALGSRHSCAVSTPSVLYCWGNGVNGELGHGALVGSTSPTRVAGRFDDWSTVSSGGSHTCGIRVSGRDRTLWCWGERGTNGRLGDGIFSGPAVPSPVAATGGITRWTSLGLGEQHGCGLTSTQQVYCWGEGADGRLGNGGTRDAATPAAISSGLHETWSQISVGAKHGCGIRSVCYPPASPSTCTDFEQLWCWGDGTDGRLGYGGAGDRTVPTLVGGPTDHQWIQVTAGERHSCGVTDAGRAFCWGENSDGRLGAGVTGLDQLTPRELSGGGVAWVTLAAGGSHTCGIRLDHTLWCWGDASTGALGLGGLVSSARIPTPMQVGSDADWARVMAGSEHTCALKMDGSLYCWGTNASGQLGTGSPAVDSSAPVRICFFDPA